MTRIKDLSMAVMATVVVFAAGEGLLKAAYLVLNSSPVGGWPPDPGARDATLIWDTLKQNGQFQRYLARNASAEVGR